VSPGTPFIVSKFSDNVNMRNMNVTHSNPELLVANAATADIFRYMGLPFCLNFGGTDCGVFDQTAAFDKGVQLYTALLSGTNMNFALGAYQSGAYAKFADFIYADEILGFLKVLTGGMEVSEETLAEEVIDEVGPGGVFFSEEHTLDHIHDFWEADLTKPCTGKEAEQKDLEVSLNNRVKEILEKGCRHPLESEIVKKLDEIMQRAVIEL
jgi:trimethylamine--corrinoid protein Co-methyltransferase